MAYNEALADHIGVILKDQPNVVGKKMFGGIVFMVSGNMCCGIVKDTLMLRVGAENYESLLSLPHAREMDFTGKPMKGMIYVDPDGFKSEAELKIWMDKALEFVLSLPAKFR